MIPAMNPHDRFFLAAMQNQAVARAFFSQYLPAPILQALDLHSLALESTTYVDEKLRKTLSDVVFSCQIAEQPARIAMLVEHQSEPQIQLPFRVHHYRFGLLYRIHKAAPKAPLPAVYVMVFYHGRSTPYPYSLNLIDSFNDPLGLMAESFTQPIPLIDVNQLSEQELKRQAWVGPMARIMKHIRDRDIGDYLVEPLEDLCKTEFKTDINLDFLRPLLEYAFSAGNIADVEHFLTQTQRKIPDPIRGEFMTLAQQLEARGEARSKREVALNFLREGVEPVFVAKNTGLSLAEVKVLLAKLKRGPADR
ncbi:MAG: Rpn family recombination-promoting nuclease/putative transposase [Pseudomonadales bacterium]